MEKDKLLQKLTARTRVGYLTGGLCSFLLMLISISCENISEYEGVWASCEKPEFNNKPVRGFTTFVNDSLYFQEFLINRKEYIGSYKLDKDGEVILIDDNRDSMEYCLELKTGILSAVSDKGIQLKMYPIVTQNELKDIHGLSEILMTPIWHYDSVKVKFLANGILLDDQYFNRSRPFLADWSTHRIIGDEILRIRYAGNDIHMISSHIDSTLLIANEICRPNEKHRFDITSEYSKKELLSHIVGRWRVNLFENFSDYYIFSQDELVIENEVGKRKLEIEIIDEFSCILVKRIGDRTYPNFVLWKIIPLSESTINIVKFRDPRSYSKIDTIFANKSENN